MQEAKAELEKARAAVAQHAKALEAAQAALALAGVKVKKAADAGAIQAKAVGSCPACDPCAGVAGKLDAILKRLDRIEQRLGALEARGACPTPYGSYPPATPMPVPDYIPVQPPGCGRSLQPTSTTPTSSTSPPTPWSQTIAEVGPMPRGRRGMLRSRRPHRVSR